MMNSKCNFYTKKQKRTKRICSHPNPLFEKWLLEWKTEAEKCGSNMKYNFKNAIKSLSKYPLPLHSGKDCLVLANFGDKICKMIDRKIEEHIEEHGSINWENHIKVKDVRRVAKNPVHKKTHRSESSSRDKESTKVLKKSSDSSNCGNHTAGRQYVPAYRSGAYALLIALDKAVKLSNSSGFLKKQELIKAAQEFCDCSFTIPIEGSYYTAWSSMSTLIKKSLVERAGNPSRYILTENGSELASLLQSTSFPTSSPPSTSSGENRGHLQKVGSCFARARPFTYRNIHISSSDGSSRDEEEVREKHNNIGEISLIDDDDDGDSIKSGGSVAVLAKRPRRAVYSAPTSPEGLNDLAFTYVTQEGMETLTKETALTSISEEKGMLLFLIKAKMVDLFNSHLDYELDETRVAPPGYTYAFISDSCAPEFRPGLAQHLEFPESLSKGAETNFDEFSNIQQKLIRRPGIALDKLKLISQTDRQLQKRPGRVKHLDDPSAKGMKKKKEPKEVGKTPFTSDVRACLRSSESPKQIPQDCFLTSLKPGSYKVILCVDNTEVFGGSNGGKQNSKGVLKAELERYGVNFQVRNLNVGDFLWTCRRHDSSGEEAELVLPFVIERKRMDDLSQSIRDGRFKEQKFRLRQSGLSHPIYLVEEFGSSYASLPLATCEQAVTNTQIIDKFTVKFTKDVKETAAYLTIMTRYLQGKFKNKTLHCVPRDSPFLSEGDWDSPVLFLMSFKELNLFSAKNHPNRLQEMLAKHLLQIHGASVDKVSSIIHKYSTPRALIEALETKPLALREKFLCDVKCQKSGRSIDQTTSAQIARLYTWETLL